MLQRGVEIQHPVSYTHLDVYKRQELINIFGSSRVNVLRTKHEVVEFAKHFVRW